MKKFLTMGVSLIVLLQGCVFALSPALAADQYCFCGSDFSNVDSKDILNDTTKINAACSNSAIPQSQCNKDGVFGQGSSVINVGSCQGYDTPQLCQSQVDAWKKAKDAQAVGAAQTAEQAQGLLPKLLPDCATNLNTPLTDPSNPCGDVSIFITLLINGSRYLFAIIGSLAIAFFVYGGVVLILSQGNAERVEQGRSIITAAVIGMIIVFGAYLLIRFLGDIINIKPEFRLK